MNRIRLPSWKQGTLGSTATPSPAASTAESACEAPESGASATLAGELTYSLFGPLHYEPNYDYPLLVWLHGAGGDERQLQQIMPHVSLRNYVAIGPRATCLAHDDAESYHWGSTFGGIVRAEQAVFDAIATATGRYRVHPGRIFVAGYGPGGTMALRVALRNPELFAGAACLGGRFPRGHMPLVALPRVPGLKLLLAHGRDSRAYPLHDLCDDLRLFHVARLAVSIRQYPTADELREPMLRDLDRWMMSIVTGQPLEAPEPYEAEAPAADAN